MAGIRAKDIKRINDMIKIYDEKYDDKALTEKIEKEFQNVIDTDDDRNLDEFERLLESEISWFPDQSLGYRDMHKYGYKYNEMLPVSMERALNLFDLDMEVFGLYPDGTESLLETKDDIRNFDGMLGVETESWEEVLYPENLEEEFTYTYAPMIPIDKTMAIEMFEARYAIYTVDGTTHPPKIEGKEDLGRYDIFQVHEADYLVYARGFRVMEEIKEIKSQEEYQLIYSNQARYGIYQLGDSEKARDYRFMGFDYIEKQGIKIVKDDYNLIYSAPLYPVDTLDAIYEKFNIMHPADFKGHSLSVSDVIVIQEEGKVSAHFVDRFGFRELPDYILTREQIEDRLNRNDISRRRDRSSLAKVEEQLEQNYNMVDDVLNNGIEKQNAVGRIDYYGADGTIQDSQQFYSEEELVKQANEQSYYGVPMAIALYKDQEGKTISREFISELDPPPKEISVENEPTVKKVEKEKVSKATLTFYVAECEEFHDMGEYYDGLTFDEAIEKYKELLDNPSKGYMGNAMGFELHDPDEQDYSDMPYPLVQGNTICGDQLDLVKAFLIHPLVREALKMTKAALPDFKYHPPMEIKEALYPPKMTGEELGAALIEIAREFEPYEYQDSLTERGEEDILTDVVHDLNKMDKIIYVEYLKNIIDDDGDLKDRAEILLDRLKAFTPDVDKNMEPVVHVFASDKQNTFDKSFYPISEFEHMTALKDKELYNSNPDKDAISFVHIKAEINYPGEGKLESFQVKMNLGEGFGGVIENLQSRINGLMQNDEWLSFQKSRGEEHFHGYMQQIMEFQDHTLPYLQQFCTLPDVEPELRISKENVASKNENIRLVKPANSVTDKGKISIHERLEINKEIIKKQPGVDKEMKAVELA